MPPFLGRVRGRSLIMYCVSGHFDLSGIHAVELHHVINAANAVGNNIQLRGQVETGAHLRDDGGLTK